MSGAFVIFLIAIFFVAIFTRDNYIFVVLYLFAGAFWVSRWWTNRVVAGLRFERQFERRVFPGETLAVRLKIKNSSRLPVAWLHTQESLPLEVSTAKVLRQVFTLPPRGETCLEYPLTPRKRGYYPIGPVQLSTGDLLGLSGEKVIQGEQDYLTVYPRVIALSKVRLPSHSPLGELRHTQPIFEDPSRPMGKRDYVAGDSLRRIDWKSSAAVGRLQTKLFEPSIALETILFLNLNANEYHYKFRYDAAELAIVVAASLANWVTAQKQSVGLVVNGSDPFAPDQRPQALSPRKGRPHLMRLLETLARVQLTETRSIDAVLHQQRVELSWGTTVIVLSGQATPELFDEFFQLRRVGLNPVLILCGDVLNYQETRLRAEQAHIPLFHLQDEQDLDIWRK